VFAESKGSTSMQWGNIRTNKEKGLSQVQNVRPIGRVMRANCGRVVISTHFKTQGNPNQQETTTFIYDPIGDKGREDIEIGDSAVRFAYAKLLRYAFRNDLAEFLIEKRAWFPAEFNFSNIESLSHNEAGIKFLPVGFDYLGQIVMLELNVFIMLARSNLS